MAITLNCPKCSKPFRVRDDVIGMRVKCPNCSAILQVPAALSPASLLLSDLPPEPMSEEPPHQPSLLNAPTGRPMIPGNRPNLTGAPKLTSPEEDVRTTFDSHTNEPPRHQTMPQMGQVALPSQQPGGTRQYLPVNAPPSNTNVSYGGDRNTSHAWSRVRAGLGYVKFGMILLLLPAIAEIARMYVMDSNPEKLDPNKPGFLGLGNMNFWQNVRLLYVAGPVVIGFLFILLGRLLCLSSPASSRTARLAFASLLCTLLSIGGIALCSYAFLMPMLGKSEPMPEIKWLGAGLGLVFGLLSEVWFSLFQGQVGFVLGYPAVQRQVGIAAMLVALTGFGILAADAFYPFLNVDAKEAQAKQLKEILVDISDEEKAALETRMAEQKAEDEKKLAESKKDEAKKEEAKKDETKKDEPKKGDSGKDDKTLKDRAAELKDKAKVLKDKAVVKAWEMEQEASKFLSNRKHLPMLALYLFGIVFVLALESVASSTRTVIRKWASLNPA